MKNHPDIRALRERGARLTPQRLITLEVVKQGQGHLTAEAIHHEVRQRYPYFSLATVYRTLQWLQEQGLVSEIDLGDGCKYYEYIQNGGHHHLICRHCRHTTEVENSILHSLKQELISRYGFEAQLEHLAIVGTCQLCREQRPTGRLGAGAAG